MTDEPASIDQPATKTNRRRYGWWMVIAVVGLLFAAGLPIAIPYQRQIALLDRIEQAGGGVGTQPVGPEWLRKLLGELRMRGFDKVVYVIVGPQTANELIKEFAGLTELRVLLLGNTQVTDSDLKRLKGLTRLEVLTLDHTLVTDEGLLHLQGMSDLRELSLRNTQVTDAGLAHLNGLAQLLFLYLENTPVSDNGLVQLKRNASLRILWLSNSQVTDAGVKDLQAALPDCNIVR